MVGRFWLWGWCGEVWVNPLKKERQISFFQIVKEVLKVCKKRCLLMYLKGDVKQRNKKLW